jgi:acetolactate synthase-1/2/3 large subunit
MNGAELFARCLVEEGVEYVFALPGEENLDLIEALRGAPIRVVVTRHEQHAAFMAAAYGRLTGKAGVCLATLGPGAMNLVTGIAHAQLGGMPLVAITGQKPVKDNRQGAFQVLDVVGVIRPLVKWNASLGATDRIPRCVRHAFKTAEGERPGACHLELPEDVAEADAGDAAPHRRVVPRRPVPDPAAVEQAAALLGAARNPVAIVSSGANRTRVGRELRAFVEATGIYAVGTQMGKGVLPEDHPQSLFSLGMHRRDWVNAALDTADLIITLGYNIVEYPPSVWNERRDKRILHIDFSPAEPDSFYNPDCELVGDISAALKALTRQADGMRFDNPNMARARAEIASRLFSTPAAAAFPVPPRRLVQDVRGVMGPDDIVSLDNGIYKVWFARMYRACRENTVLLDNALATMGAGLAGAMAAKLVFPERKVLAVCGDGGFMMNSQDLETAVRLEQGIVILLVRDDGYGFIRWKQQDRGLPDFAMGFGNPDFVRYAEAYGATGLRVDKGDGLGPALEAAFERAAATTRPVLVDCPVDYAENRDLSQDRGALAPFLEGRAGT